VVCQSVTVVSPAKTAELIKVLFGLRDLVGPRNHVLSGVQRPHQKGQFFRGKGLAHCKVWRHLVVSCAKTAELIHMPFGLRTLVGPRNHVTMCVWHAGATWRVPLNSPYAAAMWPVVKLV